MDSVDKIKDLMGRMGDLPRNFLYEYRGDTTNNAPMVSINEVNAKSLINRHTKDGYIIVSPCRGAQEFGLDPNNPSDMRKLHQINNQRVRRFIEQIKATDYSYTPVYGGFIERENTPNPEHVYERSFIIYNHDRKGNVKDFDELYKLGMEWCKEYNQDSILVQAPGEYPKYIKQDGSIDYEFTGKTKFNDFAEKYFTDLHKNTDKYKDEKGRTPTRFTFTEAYINPEPQGLTESHSRWLNNEVFLPYVI